MKPLAAQIRPQKLAEIHGQEHLIGEGKPLTEMVRSGHIFSMLLWGPTGVGKTTIARAVAEELNRKWIEISAVSAGKADLKDIILDADNNQKSLLEKYQAPIVFIDEIHRFNKAQQDYLLPFVEDGTIILIGATTENPSFEVNAALLSRMRVFVLKQLTESDLQSVLSTALTALGVTKKLDKKTSTWLNNYANGDARRLLTMLDSCYQLYTDINLDTLIKTASSTTLNYDKNGDQHYDTISAFIKSMRASDADAALYYLARMVTAGEQPTFIARRMIIFASEDIGLAQPTALVVANAVFDAVHKIGYPEAQINLAHGVAYLAKAKKNRSAYDAYFAAKSDVETFGNLPIPLKLRNAPTKLMKELEYGKNYQMYPNSTESLLPDKLIAKKYLKQY